MSHGRRPASGEEAASAKVVVIGGGIGGDGRHDLAANAAGIEVTLVEPKARYTTCFFSALYLAGMRSLNRSRMAMRRWRNDTGSKLSTIAAAIDPVAKTVNLKSGGKRHTTGWCSPRVSPNSTPSRATTRPQQKSCHMPGLPGHRPSSCDSNSQHGGWRVFDRIPSEPFSLSARPVGERASLVAYLPVQFAALEDLDPRCEGQFLRAGAVSGRLGPPLSGNDRGQPNSPRDQGVDIKDLSVKTAGDTFKGAVSSISSRRKWLAVSRSRRVLRISRAGVRRAKDFRVEAQRGIHIVGDATSGGDMPKSAFLANSQAKVCAFAIAAAPTGSARFDPHLFNTCFTFLAADDAVSDAIALEPEGGTIKLSEILISEGEDAETRRQVVKANGWYDAFTHDVFG